MSVRQWLHRQFPAEEEFARGTPQIESLQASPGEYFIQLNKSTGARLGIDVDHKAPHPGPLRKPETSFSAQTLAAPLPFRLL